MEDDSTKVRAALSLRLSEFHVFWQRAWHQSEVVRSLKRGDDAPALELRLPYVHCHPDLSTTKPRRLSAGTTAEVITRRYGQFPVIESDSSQFAACPTWVLEPAVPMAEDESGWHDAALLPTLRPAVLAARAEVLAALDSAQRRWPRDLWYTGQSIRLLVDQREFDRAMRMMTRCELSTVWCAALNGYVLARRGQTIAADSVFARMRAAMSDSARCQWDDVSVLMPEVDAKRYRDLPCAERLRINETVWWLSDPLLREPGNSRRVEQESRRVDVALRNAAVGDERFAWDRERGGDALAQLVARYGWPSYVGWSNDDTDQGHSTYLEAHRSPRVPPYTTFEYLADRVHLVPTDAAIRAPFAAPISAWQLAAESDDGEILSTWWPVEHARMDRPLLQFAEGQIAVFRRQNYTTIAAAHRVAHPRMPADTAPFNVVMLRSTSATQIDTMDARRVVGGGTAVMQSRLPATPTLMAIEAAGTGTAAWDARTRFGLTPPLPLSAMSATEIALSDPVLIDMDGRTADTRAPDAEVLTHMRGTPRISADARRIGVYWETYGIAAGDTVTIAVRIGGETELSALRRLGMAMNLASDPNRSLEIRWTEPHPQHAASTLTGPVPVQLRMIVLNLSQLAPGPYLLEVSVDRAGRGSARSQRRITVEK